MFLLNIKLLRLNCIYFTRKCEELLCISSNSLHCQSVHKGQNDTWYINNREGRNIYKPEFVSEEDIYELTRHYRFSKHNPSFSRTTITVRRKPTTDLKPSYSVMYKWNDNKACHDFIMSQHGNSAKPSCTAYFKKDLSFVVQVDRLLKKGHSTDKSYSTLNSEANQQRLRRD